MITFVYDIIFGLMFWEFKDAPRTKPNPMTQVYRRTYDAKIRNRILYNRTHKK